MPAPAELFAVRVLKNPIRTGILHALVRRLSPVPGGRSNAGFGRAGSVRRIGRCNAKIAGPGTRNEVFDSLPVPFPSRGLRLQNSPARRWILAAVGLGVSIQQTAWRSHPAVP